MKDQTYFTQDRQTCTWPVSKVICWIQTSHLKIAEQIAYWAFAEEVGHGWNNPIHIFSIPRKKWRWVLKTFGMRLPPKKLGRVRFGQNTGRKHLKKGTQAPSQKILKAIRGTHLKKEPQS